MTFAYISSYKDIKFEFNLSIWNKERIVSIFQILKKISSYQILFNYHNFKDLSKNDFLYKLNDYEEKTCIFCLKGSNETSFKKFPHVIPYLLGNNFLLHENECDECNELFGKTLECELDKYLTPHRTINKHTNRAGNLIKTDLGRNRGFRFDQTLNMFTGELDEDDVSFDANSNIVTFKLNQNKYCPMLVYKALMKIFYGLVPRNHLSKFEILRKWIINTDNNFIPFSPLNVYKSRLEGFGTNILDLIIFHKHVTNLEEFKECLPTEEDFEYLVQLRFGHIILEFPIFSDICYEKLLILKENNLPTKFNFPYIPKQGFPQIEETIDFSETRKIKNKESMYFSFDKFTKENID